MNRVWFLNEAGTELVQVQRDRFVHNWRKQAADDVYPRYETIVDSFMDELRQFAAFIAEENLGDSIRINQCEVTYVNLLALPSDAWEGHSDVGKLFTFVSFPACDHLGKPEDLSLVVRHIIPSADGGPMGRLQINLTPVFIGDDEDEGYKLQLTARGQPAGEAIEEARRFLDLGREWIVNGFACITTPAMHELWGRIQ